MRSTVRTRPKPMNLAMPGGPREQESIHHMGRHDATLRAVRNATHSGPRLLELQGILIPARPRKLPGEVHAAGSRLRTCSGAGRFLASAGAPLLPTVTGTAMSKITRSALRPRRPISGLMLRPPQWRWIARSGCRGRILLHSHSGHRAAPALSTACNRWSHGREGRAYPVRNPKPHARRRGLADSNC